MNHKITPQLFGDALERLAGFYAGDGDDYAIDTHKGDGVIQVTLYDLAGDAVDTRTFRLTEVTQ